MTRMLPLFLAPLLLACSPNNDGACNSGVREEFSAKVTTPDGPVDLTTSQCVTAGWTHTACDDGPDLCEYFFAPNVPAEVPIEFVFGDFVFRHAIGHLDLSPPDDIAGAADIEVALTTIQTDRQAEGYRASPLKRTKMLGKNPAFQMTISCDHPNIDVVCPFTWEYLLVDLDSVSPGLYADFSVRYADFVDAGNEAAPPPLEFDAWDEMIASLELVED